MTPTQFLASLTGLPRQEALEQIAGFLEAERRWPTGMSEQDRAAIVTRRVEIEAGR